MTGSSRSGASSAAEISAMTSAASTPARTAPAACARASSSPFLEDLAVGDRTHALPFIQVVRVRDGEIVEFRDYVDGGAVREALSELPELRAAVTGQQPR